ncbi:hypothetical protein HLV39_15890 [Marinobacter adhaerens]|uniref:Uncharacterized protein n=1 Tax=Marinobacter adhaerens TaxID=1033846 RepID=A0A851I4K5_9GAMM|nr:hypothetical protein [Marinobacter adhaerens]NWN92968.1 hypothetical protein [Marinobacter adhaerens]
MLVTWHEHNQLFIGGGWFWFVSFEYVHALHERARLISAARIPENERLIMMLAVSNLKYEFLVALLEKYGLYEVLVKR